MLEAAFDGRAAALPEGLRASPFGALGLRLAVSDLRTEREFLFLLGTIASALD